MGYRVFWKFVVGVCLSACSREVVRNDVLSPSTNASPECVKLRTFLSQDLALFQAKAQESKNEWEAERGRLSAKLGDPAFEKALQAHGKWQTRILDPEFWGQLTDFATKVSVASSSECPEIDRIKRLHAALLVWRPTSDAALKLESETAVRELEFEQRNRKHLFRIPGGGDSFDRAGYFDRLALTADSAQREKLFKLFNSSRALRWSSWGFRDVVLLRNEIAKSFGRANFTDLSFERAGISVADVTGLLADIRERVVPELQTRLSRLEIVGLTHPVQAWDTEWLRRTLQPKLPAEGGESQVVAAYLKGLDEDTVVGSSADLLPVKQSWQGVRRRVAEWASLKLPDTKFPDSEGVLAEGIRTLYDRLLHTMSFQTLLVRGPASEEMDRAMLVATIELVQGSLALDFEMTMYREPDRDYAEIWAEKVQNYCGMKLESFYSGWDEDAFLSDPFQSLNRVLGTVSADFWLVSLEEAFPELWGNVGLAARLKDRMQLLRPGSTNAQFTRALTGRTLNLKRYP